MANYQHHTTEEIISMLKENKLPTKEDIPYIVTRLERLLSLERYATLVSYARHEIRDL